MAKSAALKALEIDEGLAEARAVLAAVRADYDLDSVSAEKEFRRAIGLSPNYATAHQWYGEFLASSGRYKEAVAEMKQALELDPLSLAINTWFGAVLYWAGENDQAIAQLQKAIEMDKTLPMAHLWLASVFVDKNEIAESNKEISIAQTFSRCTT